MDSNFDWRRNPVYENPPCAVDALVQSGKVASEGDAYEILIVLAKAGYFIAPREPTNLMLEAYMMALRNPPRTPRSVLHNVGKARSRWRAMGSAGTKVAFSKAGRIAKEIEHEQID